MRYKGLLSMLLAIILMPLAYLLLWKRKGLRFSKVMGSGSRKGFSPLPDWSVYSVLAVWNSEEEAREYMKHSILFHVYKILCSERWTVFMKTIQCRGRWSGEAPFIAGEGLDTNNPMVAVITRATVKWSKLFLFWKQVPHTEIPLHKTDGLLFSKGLGEIPLIQMATFSIWENAGALRSYAYHSDAHKEAIRQTKTIQWYKEELFSRFQPYASVGKWNGSNPLEALLSPASEE